MHMTLGTAFLRLLIALFLGLAMGTERSIARKSVGVRTFSLVSMGSCLFIIIGLVIDQNYTGVVNFDPMRLAAAIVTGVGFIGAGMIFFDRNEKKGITSAAGLWAVSGIGMATGFGLIGIALFSTVLVIVVFTFFYAFEVLLHRYIHGIKENDD